MEKIERILKSCQGERMFLTVEEDLKSLGHNLKEWEYQTYATVAIGGLSGKGSKIYMDRLKWYAANG